MSASSKKKLRKEQAAANMTEKQKAAKKEEKKLKVYTSAFWIVLVLCVCLVAGMALKAPISGIARKMTTAVIVGDHELTAVELNYFYMDAVNNYYNQYGSYLSYFMDTSVSIDKQMYDESTNTTWADYFLDSALDSAKNNYALYDAANKAGHTLSEDEKASLEDMFTSLETTAKNYGYGDSSDYLKALYGNGSNVDSYRSYCEVTALASSYYTAYSEQLKDSYEPADLRDFEKENKYEYNSYTYLSHYLNIEKFKQGGTKDDKGNTVYSDEEIAKAEADIKAAAEALAIPENNTVEALNAAIAELEKSMSGTKTEGSTESTEGTTDKADDATEPTDATEAATEESEASEASEATEAATEATEAATETTEAAEDTTEKAEDGDKSETTDKTETSDSTTTTGSTTTTYSTCTENEDVLYSSVTASVQEWIRDEARKAGDITFLPYNTTSTDADGNEVENLKGYYIVVFQNVNDNTYALKNVRHILVSYKGGTTDDNGTTTYSDAEKATAKSDAEAILKQWEEGEKTEDSFAKLATEKTTDTGSKENGGLYEDIYPGQMVAEFEDWCFDESRKAGDTGIVQTDYGYHVMYFSGNSEINYRDYMVTEDLLAEELNDWQTALNDAMVVTEKNTSYVDRDLVLGGASSSSSDSHEGHDH